MLGNITNLYYPWQMHIHMHHFGYNSHTHPGVVHRTAERYRKLNKKLGVFQQVIDVNE